MAVSLAALLLLPTTSANAAGDQSTELKGFSTNSVCVNPPSDHSGRGYRLKRAVRFLNEQQAVVNLTYKVRPGCENTIQVSFVTPEEAVVWPAGGYAWNGDMHWSDTYQRWAYTEGFVHLVDPDPDKPEKCYAISLVIHEIGHTLGLPHSDVRRSIMHPDYNHDRHCGELGPSDLAELTVRYGSAGS